MSRRAIRYLGIHAGRYPLLSLFVVLAVTVAAGLSAWERFHVEMDVAALLPEESEFARATRWPLSDYVGHAFLLCVLEINRDEAPPEVLENSEEYLLRAGEIVGEALDDPRYFSRRRSAPERRTLGLEGNRLGVVSLFLEEDFGRLERLSSASRLREQVEELHAALSDDPSTDTLLQLRGDPFGLEEVFEERSTLFLGPLRAETGENFLLAEDGEMLLLVLWPQKASTDLLFVQELKEFLRATRTGLRNLHPEWRRTLRIDFAGPHVEAAEGASDIRNDVKWTTAFSMLFVLVLFFVAFRQPEALLLVAIPLIVGVVWALGVTSIFIDRITQVTLTFAAILIGLGIDFSIHLYNRFQEGLRLGLEPERALGDAIIHTGPSITAGAVTTFVAFFGLSLTQFTGFRELGIFGAIGIVMSLLAMILTLPPLMMLFSRFSRRSTGPVATLGLKKITFTVQAYPRLTVAIGLCVVAYFGIHAREVPFDDDFQNLRAPSPEYNELEQRIEQHFDLTSNQVFVMVQAADRQEALRANDELYQRISAVRDAHGLIGVDSLRLVAPAPRTQMENLGRFLALPMDEITANLRFLAGQFESLPDDFFEPFIAEMTTLREQARRVREIGEPVIEINDPAVREVAQRYLIHDDRTGRDRVITRIYPRADQWTDQVDPNFIATVSEGFDPPPLVAGSAILAQELKTIIIRDLTMVVLVVMALVLICLWFYFKMNIGRALLAMVPVVFALLTMFGLMHTFGMGLNYLNIIAIPMIVGIGVDSGIHLLGRFYENESHDLRLAVEKTGRAVVITNLTTICGFGSLSIASFQGIGEIGILVIIGTIATLFGALLFLPAILRLLDPKFTFSGGAGDEIG